jgi:hypothetical protein
MARRNEARSGARPAHAGQLSPTVKDAAALWIKRCNEKALEQSTIRAYEELVDLHIVPFIGAKKLSDLTVPAVNAFADHLREGGRSAAMMKRTLGAISATPAPPCGSRAAKIPWPFKR